MANYTCPICKKIFDRRGKRGGICCSKNCHYIKLKQSKNTIGDRRRGSKLGEDISCLTCKKIFYVYPGRVGRTKYCSMKCRSKDMSIKNKGENSWNWKGGRNMIGEYMFVKDYKHPFAHKKTYNVAEHRLVMEKKLGRYLDKNEEVHHINGIKIDNRIENLELVIKKMHFGNVRCPHCLQNFKVK